jgi:hypothetical protein
MLLQHLVEDFIVDHQWQIPSSLQAEFPNLLSYLNNVAIPIVEKEINGFGSIPPLAIFESSWSNLQLV